MKKAAALMLAFVLTLSLTACGGTKKNDDTEGKSALNILEDVWNTHTEEEKFPTFGGDYDHIVENAPGTLDFSNPEMIDNMFGFPAESVDLIDDGASLMHAMNQNIFTGAAYHVKEAADVEDLSASLKENILDRQWMCGFPDTLLIYGVGDNFIVAVYGNAEIIDTFEGHLTATYKSAKLLVEEDLMQ